MKTYLDHINEITEEDIFKGLLGFGLFAEKFPPFLTSEAFLDFYLTKKPSYKEEGKDYVRYENMRNINVPRPLSIPNPFAYASLCSCLSQNWKPLQKYFKKTLKSQTNQHKSSRIHIRKMKDTQCLFAMNYSHSESDETPEIDLLIKSTHIVNADISNCFPSIYSHSIPWALVGKEIAKVKRDNKEWFNKIDFHIRNIKNGETNGLLIGPHASNFISEIVLVSVDDKLIKQKYKFVRNVDDYTCYVESHEKADRFLIDLSAELKKFELSLNHKKSKICPLPKATVENWVRKLNHFNFSNIHTITGKHVIKKKELQSFLDLSIELMLENNSNSAVLNYAIKTISNKHLGIEARDYYLKQIHHLILLYPYLSFILKDFVFAPFKVSKSRIQSIACDMYLLGKRKKLYEATSYSIFWSLEYNFDLNRINLLKDALDSDDCLFLLLSFLYFKKRKMKKELDILKDKAKELNQTDFDRYWIFIYEVLASPNFKDEFRNMKKNKISFISPGFG